MEIFHVQLALAVKHPVLPTPWWVSDDSLTLVSEKAGSMRRANKASDSRYYLVCPDEKRLAGQYEFKTYDRLSETWTATWVRTGTLV